MAHSEFAVVFNPNTNKFQHQADQQELSAYKVPDSTPEQLDELNTAFQAALAQAQTKKRPAQIKVCKALHNGTFTYTHCFCLNESIWEGVISPGMVLANVLGIDYDEQNDELIDLD